MCGNTKTGLSSVLQGIRIDNNAERKEKVLPVHHKAVYLCKVAWKWEFFGVDLTS